MHANTMEPLASQRGCWVQTLDGGKRTERRRKGKKAKWGKKNKKPYNRGFVLLWLVLI